MRIILYAILMTIDLGILLGERITLDTFWIIWFILVIWYFNKYVSD